MLEPHKPNVTLIGLPWTRTKPANSTKNGFRTKTVTSSVLVKSITDTSLANPVFCSSWTESTDGSQFRTTFTKCKTILNCQRLSSITSSKLGKKIVKVALDERKIVPNWTWFGYIAMVKMMLTRKTLAVFHILHGEVSQHISTHIIISWDISSQWLWYNWKIQLQECLLISNVQHGLISLNTIVRRWEGPCT